VVYEQPIYIVQVEVFDETVKKGSIGNQLADAPVLIASVGEIAANDEGDFALTEFLHGDFEGVGFAVEGDEDGGIHAVRFCLDRCAGELTNF